MTYRGSLPPGQAYNSHEPPGDPQSPYQQMQPNGALDSQLQVSYADSRFAMPPAQSPQLAQTRAQYPQYTQPSMMNGAAMSSMNGVMAYAPYANVGYHSNQQLPSITQPTPLYQRLQFAPVSSLEQQTYPAARPYGELLHHRPIQQLPMQPQAPPQQPPPLQVGPLHQFEQPIHQQTSYRQLQLPHQEPLNQNQQPLHRQQPHQQAMQQQSIQQQSQYMLPQALSQMNPHNTLVVHPPWKGPPPPPTPAKISQPAASQPAAQPITRPVFQLAPQPIPQPIQSESKIATPKLARMPPPPTALSISSVSTPTLIQMSPSMAARRSPSVASSRSGSLVDTTPLLLGVADECIEKAREAASCFQQSVNAAQVEEYQTLIATGLSCLETVLQTGRLTPKQEAQIRLKYASVLFEETENFMEAETALSKGITLCEKHQYLDLKYCMSYLLVTIGFQRNRKAGMKTLDALISDATLFGHNHWVYALRLLKADFFSKCGNSADQVALHNLTEAASLATQAGDFGVTVLCCILQGLALIKAMKPNSIELIQQYIAQAAKYQHEPIAQNRTLSILVLLLDLMCSMHEKDVNAAALKTKKLQFALDAMQSEDLSGVIHVAIKKNLAESSIISADTAAVIRPASVDDDFDFLVVSSLTKLELYSLVHAFDSIIHINKELDRSTTTPSYKSIRNWEEGLSLLYADAKVIRGLGPKSLTLHDSIRRTRWRIELACYMHILKALFMSTRRQWDKVKEMIDKVNDLSEAWVSPDSDLALLHRYMNGAYHQGTGNLTTALEIFGDPRFSLDGDYSPRPYLDICLLAGFNRLWIMQHASHRNPQVQSGLFDRIKTLCAQHPDREIQTAWNLALVTLPKQEQSILGIKSAIHTAITTSTQVSNTFCSAISLCVLHWRLFEGIVSEQAFKSAQAASAQSKRACNPLWMSVAEGILAQAYEVQGQFEPARVSRSRSIQLANDVTQDTNVE